MDTLSHNRGSQPLGQIRAPNDSEWRDVGISIGSSASRLETGAGGGRPGNRDVPNLTVASLILIALLASAAHGELAPQCPGNECGKWFSHCTRAGADSVEATHTSLLHTGPYGTNILYWGYGPQGLFSNLILWGPGPDSNPCGTSQIVTKPAHSLFDPEPPCLQLNPPLNNYTSWGGGHDFDGEGRILIVSGFEDNGVNSGHRGSFHSLRFDPSNLLSPWTQVRNLNRIRRISTVMTHPGTGQMYVWSGTKAGGDEACPNTPQTNQYPERLIESGTCPAPGLPCWEQLFNGSSACHPPMQYSTPLVLVPESWPTIGERGQWLALSNPPNPASRPDVWLINAPADPQSCNYACLNPPSCTNRPAVQHRNGVLVVGAFELNSQGAYLPGPNLYYIGGYVVTEPISECGSESPHATVEYFDAATRTWQTKTSMTFARQDHNAVLLPDGTIFVVGGGKEKDCCPPDDPNPVPCGSFYTQYGQDCAQLEAEVFDPTKGAGGTWTKVGKHKRPRMFRSTALLLPDGSVFVGGGEYFNTVTACVPTEDKVYVRSVEIYRPPYFYEPVARPVIQSMINPLPPDNSVGFGCSITFLVQNWEQGDGRIMLIRQGTTTHGLEMSQRTVHLKIVTEANLGEGLFEITAQLPSQNEKVLTPGWHMLWVVRDWATGGKTRQPCQQAVWLKVTNESCVGFQSPEESKETDALSRKSGVFELQREVEGISVTVIRGEVEVLVRANVSVERAVLDIVDASGRVLTRSMHSLGAGENRISWDGRGYGGGEVPSGVYFARLESESGAVHVEKFVLVR